MDNKKKLKERIKSIIIILLLIVTVVLLFKTCMAKEQETAIISKDDQVVLNDNSSGDLRVKLNPVVDVKDGIMENINFSNYNEDRLLKIKIKVGEEYVYESDFLEPGEVLEKDFLDNKDFNLSGDEAIGEVYSYTKDKELIGQTNVVIQLNKKEQ